MGTQLTPEEEFLLLTSNHEIDRLYTRGYRAGRCFPIGREGQTPLEAAQEAGWKRIHTFDTCLALQEGAVGIGPDRDVLAVVVEVDAVWGVNITAESELEGESL
jgi:hypothetical protein